MCAKTEFHLLQIRTESHQGKYSGDLGTSLIFPSHEIMGICYEIVLSKENVIQVHVAVIAPRTFQCHIAYDIR